jgi:hypothetical protein
MDWLCRSIPPTSCGILSAESPLQSMMIERIIYDITLYAFGIEDIIPISDDRFAINPSLMGIAPEGGRVIERIPRCRRHRV